MKPNEAFNKLGDVREEFFAAKFSLVETLRAYNADAEVHHAGNQQHVTLGHLQVCSDNLQITYVLRLFAEFEGILRDYWHYARKRTTDPPMAVLMDSLAAYCHMKADDVRNAHEVREYRNDVVHDHLQDSRLDFPECCSRLARFLRWLPQRW